MNRYTFILNAHEQEEVTLKADRVTVDQFGARLYVGDELVGHVRHFDAFSKDRNQDRPCRPTTRCPSGH